MEDYFETFEQVYDDRFPRQYGFLRPYVKPVIYRYLDCGILQNSFAREHGGNIQVESIPTVESFRVARAEPEILLSAIVESGSVLRWGNPD